jgi:OmpA-OmpF porin, OOP family
MRFRNISRRGVALLAVVLAGSMAIPAFAQTQAAGAAEEWITRLASPDTAPDIDVAALKQAATDRIKARSKADAAPLKRAPIAPELLKLPQIAADIQFDEDGAVVRPESYRMLGRIADTLSHPSLWAYKFLIVGHTASTGRRENNLTLSQRRADVIRDIMVNTFKISGKRLQSLGLGEEQMLDNNRPTAPVNAQFQLMTVGKAP